MLCVHDIRTAARQCTARRGAAAGCAVSGQRAFVAATVGATLENLVLARQESKLEANFQIDCTCQYKI